MPMELTIYNAKYKDIAEDEPIESRRVPFFGSNYNLRNYLTQHAKCVSEDYCRFEMTKEELFEVIEELNIVRDKMLELVSERLDTARRRIELYGESVDREREEYAHAFRCIVDAQELIIADLYKCPVDPYQLFMEDCWENYNSLINKLTYILSDSDAGDKIIIDA